MKKLHTYVAGQIKQLEEIRGTSGGKARLARLRRGVGKIPGELPELWGEFLNGIPEEFLSKSGEATKGEWAIYLSLTLYALHQQGNNDSMNKKGESLGKAASELLENKNDDEERERVLRRFGPIITASSMPELAHHLRCIIQLFSANSIKLDYVRLAEDIFYFQSEDYRKRVQLKWGQDFYYKGE